LTARNPKGAEEGLNWK